VSSSKNQQDFQALGFVVAARAGLRILVAKTILSLAIKVPWTQFAAFFKGALLGS
jgi:hypothetical protein